MYTTCIHTHIYTYIYINIYVYFYSFVRRIHLIGFTCFQRQLHNREIFQHGSSLNTVVIASATSGLTDSPLNAFRAALHGYYALLRHVSITCSLYGNIFATTKAMLNDRFATNRIRVVIVLISADNSSVWWNASCLIFTY